MNVEADEYLLDVHADLSLQLAFNLFRGFLCAVRCTYM